MNGTATFPARGRFDGVSAIIACNWPWYLAGAATPAAALLVGLSRRAPGVAGTTVAAGAGLALWWTLASLGVSHLVYDRSQLTRWEWLDGLLGTFPRRWLALHAGADEASPWLQARHPGTTGTVFDLYDPNEMSAPSIARARSRSRASRWVSPIPMQPLAERISLALDGEPADDAFLIFTAHEFRRHSARVQAMRAAHANIRPSGRIVLVEHLRDPLGFLAFGPGFMHFYSNREWLRVISDAGLRVQRTAAVTPFVRAYVIGGG